MLELIYCRLCHSFLTQFLRTRRAICSTDRTYELPGSHVWAVMSSEKSRSPAMAIKVSKSRHNSRTKLRMKLLYVQKRDNVEFYLCCKFQLSPFSVRRKTDVKDGMTDKQTNELLYASTLGIISVLLLNSQNFSSNPP